MHTVSNYIIIIVIIIIIIIIIIYRVGKAYWQLYNSNQPCS